MKKIILPLLAGLFFVPVVLSTEPEPNVFTLYPKGHFLPFTVERVIFNHLMAIEDDQVADEWCQAVSNLDSAIADSIDKTLGNTFSESDNNALISAIEDVFSEIKSLSMEHVTEVVKFGILLEVVMREFTLATPTSLLESNFVGRPLSLDQTLKTFLFIYGDVIRLLDALLAGDMMVPEALRPKENVQCFIDGMLNNATLFFTHVVPECDATREAAKVFAIAYEHASTLLFKVMSLESYKVKHNRDESIDLIADEDMGSDLILPQFLNMAAVEQSQCFTCTDFDVEKFNKAAMLELRTVFNKAGLDDSTIFSQIESILLNQRSVSKLTNSRRLFVDSFMKYVNFSKLIQVHLPLSMHQMSTIALRDLVLSQLHVDKAGIINILLRRVEYLIYLIDMANPSKQGEVLQMINDTRAVIALLNNDKQLNLVPDRVFAISSHLVISHKMVDANQLGFGLPLIADLILERSVELLRKDAVKTGDYQTYSAAHFNLLSLRTAAKTFLYDLAANEERIMFLGDHIQETRWAIYNAFIAHVRKCLSPFQPRVQKDLNGFLSAWAKSNYELAGYDTILLLPEFDMGPIKSSIISYFQREYACLLYIFSKFALRTEPNTRMFAFEAQYRIMKHSYSLAASYRLARKYPELETLRATMYPRVEKMHKNARRTDMMNSRMRKLHDFKEEVEETIIQEEPIVETFAKKRIMCQPDSYCRKRIPPEFTEKLIQVDGQKEVHFKEYFKFLEFKWFTQKDNMTFAEYEKMSPKNESFQKHFAEIDDKAFYRQMYEEVTGRACIVVKPQFKMSIPIRSQMNFHGPSGQFLIYDHLKVYVKELTEKPEFRLEFFLKTHRSQYIADGAVAKNLRLDTRIEFAHHVDAYIWCQAHGHVFLPIHDQVADLLADDEAWKMHLQSGLLAAPSVRLVFEKCLTSGQLSEATELYLMDGPNEYSKWNPSMKITSQVDGYVVFSDENRLIEDC